MTDAEYIATQRQLVLCAGLSMGLRIDLFLERIDLAERKGQELNPDLYAMGIDRMRAIADIARAVQQLQLAHAALLHGMAGGAVA